MTTGSSSGVGYDLQRLATQFAEGPLPAAQDNDLQVPCLPVQGVEHPFDAVVVCKDQRVIQNHTPLKMGDYQGPAFPSPLVDASLLGEVVFLYGAGVSAPQLPEFGGLVKPCFPKLNVQMRSSELRAFE